MNESPMEKALYDERADQELVEMVLSCEDDDSLVALEDSFLAE